MLFADDTYGPLPNPTTGMVGPTSFAGAMANAPAAAGPSTGNRPVTIVSPTTEHLNDGEPGGHRRTTARSMIANPTTWLVLTIGVGILLAWYARGDFDEFVELVT